MSFFNDSLFRARIVDTDKTITPDVARDVTAYIADVILHTSASEIYFRTKSILGRDETLLVDWTQISLPNNSDYESDYDEGASEGFFEDSVYTFSVQVPIDTTGTVRLDFKIITSEGEYITDYDELTLT